MRRHGASFVAIAALAALLGASLMARAEGPAVALGTAPLPFDAPSTTVLRNSSHKVFAHYMTTFPISIDNANPDTDYYANEYLNPLGESGRHWSYGGFIRERPQPRPAIASDSWQVTDMQTDVRRAVSAGIDGFTMDILGLSGSPWNRLKNMLQAAQAEDPGFRIVLMPDASVASVVADADLLASQIASIANSPSLYRLADGRLVISPFLAERQSAAWWQGVLGTLNDRYGIAVAFVLVFLDYQTNAAAFSSISYGFSIWGGRSPASNQGTAALIADAHARGKIWMQPVAVQDTRPRAGVYDEADNSETLRATWSTSINDNADWVQLATWNDYSETSEFAPSTHIGWGPLDISSYYINWFKLGSAPTITRDVVYISHRQQFTAAAPTGGQTRLMDLRGGSSPARDGVEILTFLVAPATVSAFIGPNTYTFAAPAGLTAMTYPLALGGVSATISYTNGVRLSIASPFKVIASPSVQDLQYRFISSGRTGFTAVGPTTSVPVPSTTTAPPPTVAPGPSTTVVPPTAGPDTAISVATGLPPMWTR